MTYIPTPPRGRHEADDGREVDPPRAMRVHDLSIIPTKIMKKATMVLPAEVGGALADLPVHLEEHVLGRRAEQDLLDALRRVGLRDRTSREEEYMRKK